jgi:hypothetical protein
VVSLGELDEALDHIKRSIALFTPLGDWRALQRTHHFRGEIPELGHPSW